MFGLVHGVTYGINQRGRWEIPDLVAADEERTFALFQNGELNEPLVMIHYLQKQLGKRTAYSDAEIPPPVDSPFFKAESVKAKEDETDFEIIQTRKGRSLSEISFSTYHDSMTEISSFSR